jgi:short-subunit dehydrogenase
MNARGTTALITGASGGIGYEIARFFAQDRHNLVLVARSQDRLEAVAAELRTQFGVTVWPFACDLAEASAPQSLFDRVRREGLAIDFLVNNAGYGKLGLFSDVTLGESLGQIQLNITALTSLTKSFLGPMLERRSGRILNVASTAGFQPGPFMAVYYATKAYVISFSEAIANELAGSGVTVTCLCPGPTGTDFARRAGNDHSRLFQQMRPMTAKAVARDGYRAMMKGKTLVISGFRNWAVAESVRFTPRKLVTAISRWVSESAN